LARSESVQPDRRLNVEEAAAKLGMSKDKLYRRANSFPFTIRIDRSLGFSEQGIDRWLRSKSGARMP
jgi:predicted DNA-binding transcriptional regulator AlpA